MSAITHALREAGLFIAIPLVVIGSMFSIMVLFDYHLRPRDPNVVASFLVGLLLVPIVVAALLLACGVWQIYDLFPRRWRARVEKSVVRSL